MKKRIPKKLRDDLLKAQVSRDMLDLELKKIEMQRAALLEAAKEFIKEAERNASWDKVGRAYQMARKAVAEAENI